MGFAVAQRPAQGPWRTTWTIDAAGALTVPQIARRLGVSCQHEQRVVGDLVGAADESHRGILQRFSTAEMRRSARHASFDEEPVVDLDSEAVDFRVASELFASKRRLRRWKSTLASAFRAPTMSKYVDGADKSQ